MVDNTQANWNAIKIVYGSRYPSVRMIDKECTCLFHYTQSFNKHIKLLIKHEFQDQHIFFLPLISKDSWLIMHKPIGTLLELFMDRGTFL